MVQIVVAGKHDITSVAWYLEYAPKVEGMEVEHDDDIQDPPFSGLSSR